MKMSGMYVFGAVGVAGIAGAAFGQHEIPVDFEVDGAADIRAVFDPTFTDLQMDGAKGLATDGDTLLVGRTHKIDIDVAPAGQDALVPGEVLIYRKNLSGTDFDLVGRLNDSVVGTPGASLVSPNDMFGWTVAIEKNTMAVGSPYYGRYVDPTDPASAFVQDNTGAGYGDEDETGAVFIYTRPSSASDTWTLTQILYDDRPVNGERFGQDVYFHGGNLVVTTPRNWTPGFSRMGPPGTFPSGDGCQNIGSAVSVFRKDVLTGEFGLEQYIELPFFMSEWVGGGPPVPNGDPLDMQGDCDGFIYSTPPIASRDGVGFGRERARELALDGEWLLSVGQFGVLVYKYDYVDQEYDFYQEVVLSAPSGGSGLGGSGYTSISMHDGVAVVGVKKFTVNAPNPKYRGALIMLEYDAVSGDWVQTTDWYRTTHTGSQLGIGVSIQDDTVVGYSKFAAAALFRYDRVNDELLYAGRVPGAGTNGPASKTAWYEDTVLLSDNEARNPGRVNIVRAVTSCPTDIDEDGVVNFFDLSLYMTWYGNGDLRADYVEPFGVLDGNDVLHFQALMNLGCP